MQICMLVEPNMLPIPSTLTGQSFGTEHLVDDKGKHVASGEVYVLTGSKEDLVKWLIPFDCVWQSSSPMLGDWTPTHISTENKG